MKIKLAAIERLFLLLDLRGIKSYNSTIALFESNELLSNKILNIMEADNMRQFTILDQDNEPIVATRYGEREDPVTALELAEALK